MEILVIAALLGLIPAFIAKSKGRSMFGWWLYGTLLWIVALIHSLCMKDLSRPPQKNEPFPDTANISPPDTCRKCGHVQYGHLQICKGCGYDKKSDPEGLYTDNRECPFCAELIKKKAIKCKHCGSAVEPIEGHKAPKTTSAKNEAAEEQEPSDTAHNVNIKVGL